MDVLSHNRAAKLAGTAIIQGVNMQKKINRTTSQQKPQKEIILIQPSYHR
jgi:hypothetical protein